MSPKFEIEGAVLDFNYKFSENGSLKVKPFINFNGIFFGIIVA